RPAARRGPPWLLIGGAALALIIFVGVGFSGILTGISSNDLQNSIATAVSQQGTAQAQQGDQIRLALTQLANSGGSLAAQQTAIAQATVADVALKATATAVIARVATVAADSQAAKSNKGPGGESIVVVPVVFPPPPVRSFVTPLPLPSPQAFTG